MIVYAASCCPPTRTHIEVVVRARDILIGKAKPVTAPLTSVHDACVALICCDRDEVIRRKLTKAKCDDPYLSIKFRERLLHMEIEEVNSPMSWIAVVEGWPRVSQLQSRYPSLSFSPYALNGADEVVVDRKWIGSSRTRRLITIGRGEYTKQVLKAVKNYSCHPDYFIVGAAVSEASCSVARKALREANQAALKSMLCPSSMRWLQHAKWSPFSKFYRKHLPRLIAEARGAVAKTSRDKTEDIDGITIEK